MKRAYRRGFVAFGLLVVIATGGWGAKASAQNVQDFTIHSFTADYYLSRTQDKTPQMTVNERIVAEFPSYDQNHGILRAIPESYKGHSLALTVTGVTDGNGQAMPYSRSDQNGNLVLRIGNANDYVHGKQTYDIGYKMQYVTTNYTDHDELYWDVNGDQWSQQMDSVTARLHLSSDLVSRYDAQLQCFAGNYGSTDSGSCTASQSVGNTSLITIQSTRALRAGETLTFVTGFKSQTFATYHVSLARMLFIATCIGGPILLASIFILSSWWRNGRDPRGRGTIVPEYLPPKDVSILMSGVVLKEKFETSFISAQMIDLAVRHYIRIYEVKEVRRLRKDKTHYEIELIKTLDDLRPEEREVGELLFMKDAPIGMRVSLDDLSKTLYQSAQSLSIRLIKQMTADGYFTQNPTKMTRKFVVLGTVLIASVFFIHSWFVIGFGVAGGLFLLGTRIMSARSADGVTLREYLLGVQYYMQVAEAERIKILQSPSGAATERIAVDPKNPAQLVKLYERLLPYAMLFGIEKEWAKQFADLYQTPPDWFVGSWTTFNAVLFVSALNGFSTMASTNFSPPSNSSSSGFGGGGFAGGGGGGGGGGGW